MNSRSRAGFTVIEMIITIFIVGVLGAIVTATLTKSLQDNARVEQETIVQRDLSLALDRVGKVIRSTTQLLAASQTNLKIRGFAKSADQAPSEIEYYLENGSWKFSVIAASGLPPDYIYLSSDKVVSILAGKLTNDNNNPLF
ncbi:MAG: type II secretion system protein, partial [Patescibacteria group bacterium]